MPLDRPLRVRRKLIVVPARLLFGRGALEAAAVQLDAVEISLRGVLGRGSEVNGVRCCVDSHDPDHVEVAVGYARELLPVPASAIQMLPAVAFTKPQELAPIVN